MDSFPELRRAVRSSLYKKDLSGHTHEYGAETYDEEEDLYKKACLSCEHVMTYEKMWLHPTSFQPHATVNYSSYNEFKDMSRWCWLYGLIRLL